MADAHGNEKQNIEENFTIYRPTDTHERLQHSAADVERDEEKAFHEKGDFRPALLKHAGKQQQKQEGTHGHKIIRRQDTDKPLSQKVCGVLVGGEHYHEAADAEEDIHTESAAVQKAYMFQYNKQGRDASQGLYAVKMHLMKILLMSVHKIPRFYTGCFPEGCSPF